MEVKYGIELDEADSVRKVAKLGGSGGEAADVARGALWPMEVVARINASADLRLRTRRGGQLIGLRVECYQSPTFEDLRRQVARMPGTARAAAVVAAERTPGTASKALACLAVFREHYTKPGFLMGREVGAPGLPLRAVGAAELRVAAVMDPQVTCLLTCGDGPACGLRELPPPALREEYMTLGAWLLPDETASRPPPPEGGVGHVGAKPWSAVLAEAGAFAPAPTAAWMARMRRALDHPDVGGRELLALLRCIMGWLEDGEGPAARHAAHVELEVGGLYRGLLVCVLRAAVAPSPERGWAGIVPSSGGDATDLEVGIQSARILHATLADSAARSKPLVAAGATSALCQFMRRWPDRVEVQSAALAVFADLLGVASAAAEALQLDLPTLMHSAVSRHPGIAEIQSASEKAMQQFYKNPKDWMLYRQRKVSLSLPTSMSTSQSNSHVER